MLTYRQEVASRIPHDRQAVGVEVGVWHGGLSRYMLTKRPLLTLHMVDPWQSERRTELWNQESCDAARRDAYRVARKFSSRARILEAPSNEAAAVIESNSLDFVFFDAVHTREAIAEYIVEWMPKLKVDGWYGGRDFPERWCKDLLDIRRTTARPGRDRTWFAI